VQLTLEQKGELLRVIEHGAQQTVGGFDALPEGIFELRNALHDDLYDANAARDA